MRKLALALLICSLPFQCAGLFGDRSERRAEIAAEMERRRLAAEQMRRRLWREKQWSKIVDGIKDHLAKGRFKYLIIGFTSGAIITSAGIWFFCHDGCRFFNPPNDYKRYWRNYNRKKEQNDG